LSTKLRKIRASSVVLEEEDEEDEEDEESHAITFLSGRDRSKEARVTPASPDGV